jgi:release factor glutamine methyltransferase
LINVAAPAPARIWTISEVLRWTQEHFAKKGIESARLDAELLLADVLKVDRVHLYTHFDQPLSSAEREQYRALVQRRAQREPVAYILGAREFFGRALFVNRDVLIPRPETEHLVEVVLAWCQAHDRNEPKLAELCTGSGAVAVALALALPLARIVATDISAEALRVAQQNLDRYQLSARCQLLAGDLFAPLAAQALVGFDAVIANPPYIKNSERALLAPEILTFEPHQALFAGDDGLDIIRRLSHEAPRFLNPGGLWAVEIGHEHGAQVQALLAAEQVYTNVRVQKDLAGRDRIVVAELRA